MQRVVMFLFLLQVPTCKVFVFLLNLYKLFYLKIKQNRKNYLVELHNSFLSIHLNLHTVRFRECNKQ